VVYVCFCFLTGCGPGKIISYTCLCCDACTIIHDKNSRFPVFLYGAMFDFAEVTENGIRCSNIHLLRLLSIGDCYSRDT